MKILKMMGRHVVVLIIRCGDYFSAPFINFPTS